MAEYGSKKDKPSLRSICGPPVSPPGGSVALHGRDTKESEPSPRPTSEPPEPPSRTQPPPPPPRRQPAAVGGGARHRVARATPALTACPRGQTRSLRSVRLPHRVGRRRLRCDPSRTRSARRWRSWRRPLRLLTSPPRARPRLVLTTLMEFALPWGSGSVQPRLHQGDRVGGVRTKDL